MGVGGDDSWSPTGEPPHCLQSAAAATKLALPRAELTAGLSILCMRAVHSEFLVPPAIYKFELALKPLSAEEIAS